MFLTFNMGTFVGLDQRLLKIVQTSPVMSVILAHFNTTVCSRIFDHDMTILTTQKENRWGNLLTIADEKLENTGPRFEKAHVPLKDDAGGNIQRPCCPIKLLLVVEKSLIKKEFFTSRPSAMKRRRQGKKRVTKSK